MLLALGSRHPTQVDVSTGHECDLAGVLVQYLEHIIRVSLIEKLLELALESILARVHVHGQNEFAAGCVVLKLLLEPRLHLGRRLFTTSIAILEVHSVKRQQSEFRVGEIVAIVTTLEECVFSLVVVEADG